jgi:hypothetical protein
VYDQHGYEAQAGQWLQRWNDHLAMLRPESVDNPGAIAFDIQSSAAAMPKGSRDGRARLPAS